MLGLQRLTKGLAVQWLRRASSSSVKVAGVAPTPVEQLAEDINATKKTRTSSMVAAAFQSLKEETPQAKDTAAAGSSIDERIVNAKTVNGLLSVSEVNGQISRKHALKIVSILAEWSSINRAKLSEFENDSRFIKVCRVLGRTLPKANGNETGNQKRISGFRTDDLNTVLGVAGDDEAAKLIASISLPQMVKVMSTLAQRKRRSTPLLRSLAFNISSTSEVLDVKQTADILFAMASLNFKDAVLTAKVCADIQTTLPKNTDKSSVVGSILTSLGILKYRDLDVLEALVQWTLTNSEICRPQDLSALFLTMAILNYQSASLEQIKSKLVPILSEGDFQKQTDWLNHVWALTMLGLVHNSHIETVLSETFIKKLETEKGGLSPNAQMKLLNINSYSRLIASSYKGPNLPADSSILSVPVAHNKSKQILLNGMLDALKSFLPSSNHVQSSINSKMGFLIDAQVTFDSKRNPLSLDQNHPDAIKIALMIVDFHDLCHGSHSSISGLCRLRFDLLEKSGYKVLPVPYNEFNTSDKLLKRVQYLEGNLKKLISSK